jgi:hypothetical protein
LLAFLSLCGAEPRQPWATHRCGRFAREAAQLEAAADEEVAALSMTYGGRAGGGGGGGGGWGAAMELLGVCLHAAAVQHEQLRQWAAALAAHRAAAAAAAHAGSARAGRSQPSAAALRLRRAERTAQEQVGPAAYTLSLRRY